MNVRWRLTEIEEVNEDVRVCDAAALEGVLMLDELEATKVRPSSAAHR